MDTVSPPRKREFLQPPTAQCRSLATELNKVPNQSKPAIPKSLSVLEMLKLGKEINEKATHPIELFGFDIDLMAWSGSPTTVEFAVEKEAFGEGGFRKAFKATSTTPGFRDRQWVVKRYIQASFNIINAINQTIEQPTKKVIQMHMLARNFAAQLEQKLRNEDNLELYGETLRYKKIYLGKEEDGSVVSVEEYIDGKFAKYLNNNGEICGDESHLVQRQKAESLAHFSYEHSSYELMVVDMQGSGNCLVDPEIASKDQVVDDEYLFSAGNLTKRAIQNFVEAHRCNLYCELLGLQELNSL